jgi:hypothetical protein
MGSEFFFDCTILNCTLQEGNMILNSTMVAIQSQLYLAGGQHDTDLYQDTGQHNAQLAWLEDSKS